MPADISLINRRRDRSIAINGRGMQAYPSGIPYAVHRELLYEDAGVNLPMTEPEGYAMKSDTDGQLTEQLGTGWTPPSGS